MGVRIFILLIFTCTALRVLPQQNPDQYPGLALWLKADEGVILNGNFVSQWSDFSGNNRHATSSADVIRPKLVSGVLNGMPAISFDGIEDFLEFPEITDARTIFWVLRENPAANGIPYRPLLGWSGGFNFLRGSGEQFWDPQYSSPAVHNGSTRMNLQPINGTQQVVPNDFSIVSLSTVANVQASHITMEWNIYGRTWWGEIAELIIYNQALSVEEVENIELYLADKYSPTYTPISDVSITYGFCESTVCAPEGFFNYQWSSGDSGSCIQVGENGQYSVTYSDQFGRTYSDTVVVSYPGNTQLADAVICAGSQFYWDTQLDVQLYTHLLNGNVVGPEFSIDQPGDYLLQISDQNDCSVVREFVITVDDFPNIDLLGPDQTLCAGNIISPVSGSENIISYEWNDSGSDNQLVITETGEYWLKATNGNGCVNSDTIVVNISGIAPEVNFIHGLVCEEAPVEFLATAQATSQVQQWNWNFGDGNTGTGQNVVHEFQNSGMFNVQLTAVGQGGCTTVIQQVVFVHPRPEASFTTGLLCMNIPVIISDNSTAQEGVITESSWVLGGNIYDGLTTEYTFGISGFNSVIHTVTNSIGCSAEVNALVDVRSPPQVDWNASGFCLGQLTGFTSQVTDTQFPITSYYWDFGDETYSQLQNPNHYYASPGNYPVRLTAQNSFGCSAAFEENLTIYSLPNPDFLIRNACQGREFVFTDQTVSAAGDPVLSWKWSMNDDQFSSSQQASLVFQNLGLNAISLTVVSQQGCTGSVTQQIPVWPVPHAQFDNNPDIAEAPAEIQFTNQTPGVSDVLWLFGDTHESEELNPVHVFTLNGTFYTQLIATNTYGCADTTGRIITIAVPVLDIRVKSVVLVPMDIGTEIKCELTNMGNIPVERLLMSWQVGNDTPVKEVFEMTLLPGESTEYTFFSVMQKSASQYNYVCVGAEIMLPDRHEVNMTDNSYCKPIRNGELELFPPFPNPGDDRMFVRFMTPVSGDLTLLVFDNLGNVVMEIADMDVPDGFHQYFMDISSLATGSYRLMIKMGSRNATVAFMKIRRE